MPVRIQRKRTKGWKMPPNTIYVGRGSKWGNPFKIPDMVNTNQEAVDFYDAWLNCLVVPYIEGKPVVANLHPLDGFRLRDQIIFDLRGKNLACWCALDQPCHAEVLLKIANQDRPWKRR